MKSLPLQAHNSRLNQADFYPSVCWRESLSNAITDPKQLCKKLQISNLQLISDANLAAKDFKLMVPGSYLNRMTIGDLEDPLLKQVLPLAEELNDNSGYTLDPLGETEATAVPGVLHKYHGRALLITNGHCAINCRFCFRRNFPYQANHLSTDTNEAVFDYLAQDSSISEVILSGGDPLLQNSASLAALFKRIEAIPHVSRLRIHSRIPIVLPERIDRELCQLFSQTRLNVVMVVHCNHAREIAEDVSNALILLNINCHSVLNQSVLLKGVNDSVADLMALQEALFENRVQSYYLHLLDKVKGVAHFDIPQAEATSLYRQLAQICPGHMLPKLVQEQAGEPMKSPINFQ